MKLVIGTRLRDELELIPWFLANTRFADRVCVVDGGSVDGSWDYLYTMEKLDWVNPQINLRIKKWEGHGGWYVEQGNHFRTLLDMVREENPDWFLYLDVDNIPSLMMQHRLKNFLEGLPPVPMTGVIMDEFSLAPGWVTHYIEISPAPILFLWNFVPEVYNTDKDTPLYYLEEPVNTVEVPKGICQFHWNWAMGRRFAEKMVRYLGSPPAHGQTVSWHPDEKYTERAPLPPYAQWHAPDGAIIGPGDMLNTPLNEEYYTER